MIVNAWYTVLEFHIHLSGMIEGQVFILYGMIHDKGTKFGKRGIGT